MKKKISPYVNESLRMLLAMKDSLEDLLDKDNPLYFQMYKSSRTNFENELKDINELIKKRKRKRKKK